MRVSIIISYTSSFCNPYRLIPLTIKHLRNFLIFGKNNSRAKIIHKYIYYNDLRFN